jgi:UDP-2,3-diacylglucosamine pyrophosphatase LpxH
MEEHMADTAGASYLVLSDMHFGTIESSINELRYRDPLIRHIVANAPWQEIIFTGDLLDVNLSTLTRAIEGGTWPGLPAPLFGFREFIYTLDARMRESTPPRTLRDVTRQWVYVPGNHDYKIWDLLATRMIFEDVIASGRPIDRGSTPLKKYRWVGDQSFFAGIFQPYRAASDVIVEYPNHEIAFKQDQESMVLTHGHYLDPVQTRGNGLSDQLQSAKDPMEVEQLVRKIFIETAQFQTMANAVSFTKGFRNFFKELARPDGWKNKLRKLWKQTGEWLTRAFFPTETLRGRPLSSAQLLNIECYLERFCGYTKVPRWFVFGHTHRQGIWKTNRLGIEAYNAGSCYLDQGMAITFATVRTDVEDRPKIELMGVDLKGVMRTTHAT